MFSRFGMLGWDVLGFGDSGPGVLGPCLSIVSRSQNTWIFLNHTITIRQNSFSTPARVRRQCRVQNDWQQWQGLRGADQYGARDGDVPEMDGTSS